MGSSTRMSENQVCEVALYGTDAAKCNVGHEELLRKHEQCDFSATRLSFDTVFCLRRTI